MKFPAWIGWFVGIWGWTVAQAAAVHAEDAFWKGESGGFELSFSKSAIAARPLAGSAKGFSLAEEFKARCAEFAKFSDEMAAELPPEAILEEWKRAEISNVYKPLSVVGPYLSIERSEYRVWPGAAHPAGGNEFRVIDLRQPSRAVHLTDLFAESAILAALREDRVVKKALRGAKPKSLAELREKIDPMPVCDYSFEAGFMDHFALFAVQGDKVAVRIGLTHGCEAARGKLTQLGILLPIPPALKESLVAADRGKAGFVMRDASAKLRGQTTALECIHEVKWPKR